MSNGSAIVALTAPSEPPVTAAPREPRPARREPSAKKLSYRERLELEGLPARIDALEAEQARLEASIAGADFYKESAAAITTALGRIETVRSELEAIYRRWDELDSRPR